MGGELFISNRIIEAYIGEYASGKSEVAINRALELSGLGQEVTLADLDLVEPFYTLRPIKKVLQDKGLQVIAWETKDTLGLGEAGNVIKPEMRWVLRRPGNIILDIGYGVEGAKTLNLLEETDQNKELKIFVVVNTGRPMTSTINDIVDYVKDLGTVDGLINNSHLGDETEIEFVQSGAMIVKEAAERLGVPMVATYIEETLYEKVGRKDITGTPFKKLSRFMKASFW